MKLAFVANTHGNLDLLEAVALMLVERMDVGRVVPVGSAVYDLDAVLRSRAQRYPAEVPWTSAGFADFVLASVLHGVSQVPVAELRRNALLDACALSEAQAERGLVIGDDVCVGVVLPAHPRPMGAVLVRATPEHRGAQLEDGHVLISPGHLRGRDQGAEPASCCLVTATGRTLSVRFVDPDGADLSDPLTIEVPR